MNLQSSRLEPIFENQIAVTSGNGSSFNTSLNLGIRRTGGAECLPKKNPVPVCVDYASTTNRSLWCPRHRPQEPAPNCRSLLRDGGRTLYRVGDNESPTRHFKSFADLAIGSLAFPITDFCVQFLPTNLTTSEVARLAIGKKLYDNRRTRIRYLRSETSLIERCRNPEDDS